MMLQKENRFQLQRFSLEAGAETAGEEASSDAGTKEDSGLSFEALLKDKPEYKAAYDAKVKKAIEGRFRQVKQMEDAHARANAVLKAMAQHYSIPWEEGQDTKPLMDAISAEPQRPSREESRRRLQEQAAALRSRYPSFRLEREMQNPTFGRLVARGTPMDAAYRLTHAPEALAQAMSYAITRTRQALADQKRIPRPSENGMTPKLSPQASPDPKSLTRQQRQNLRSRVARGEKVYW